MNQKNFLLIAGFTFMTVFVWIGLTIYHTRVTSTVSQDLQKQVEPIAPQFDTAVIQALKYGRKSVTLLPESEPASLASPSGGPASSSGGLNL